MVNPLGSIFKISFVPLFDTHKLPAESNANPVGASKTGTPLNTKLLTTPPGVILHMVSVPPLFDTYNIPALSNAKATGVDINPPAANIDMTPEGVILEILFY